MCAACFEGLYNSDADGNPVPGVAESHTVNEDNTVYTFKLRDTAKWSNGDPVTAGDFVYAWQRAVDPATASTYAYFVGLVGVVNADDIVAGKKPLDRTGRQGHRRQDARSHAELLEPRGSSAPCRMRRCSRRPRP